MYLLDTSTFKATAARQLLALKERGVPIAISAYTMWEVLSHLDEEDFLKARGHALKAKHVTALDDPMAIADQDLGARSDRRAHRPDDGDLIRAWLERLERSSRLKDAHATPILQTPTYRLWFDDPARMRQKLEAAEAVHLGLLQRIQARIGNGEFEAGTDDACHGLILHFVDVIAKARIGASLPADRPELWLRAVDRWYLHAASLLEVARRAVRGGKEAEANDLEDAMIALHVRLSDPVIFCTADAGLAQVLNTALERLACVESAGISPQVGVRWTSPGREWWHESGDTSSSPAP